MRLSAPTVYQQILLWRYKEDDHLPFHRAFCSMVNPSTMWCEMYFPVILHRNEAIDALMRLVRGVEGHTAIIAVNGLERESASMLVGIIERHELGIPVYITSCLPIKRARVEAEKLNLAKMYAETPDIAVFYALRYLATHNSHLKKVLEPAGRH